MGIMNPKQRAAANKKSPNIPTRNANPTSAAGKGVKKSSKTKSTRYSRAALYRAKGEKII